MPDFDFERIASNAQAAIISNSDTLKEITKAVSIKNIEDPGNAFFEVVAKLAVKHAAALVKELNEGKH